MKKYSMDQFFNWLSKPMRPEDIDTWNRANNIIPEFCDLFEDFSFSLYYLVRSTYLGHSENNETKIGVTHEEKVGHFQWCWNKTLDNFKKENITFKFSNDDYDYFESFYFEVFYNQKDKGVREAMEEFFVQLFNRKRAMSKSDIEMFTDLYKTLERSLQV